MPTTAQLTLSLADSIADALKQYGYSEREADSLGCDELLYRIMTPRKRMVRYLCVVTEVPAETHFLAGCKTYFEHIRTLLFNQYAKFPWWKELGTYSVLLCRSELYDQLKGGVQFKDRTGFHGNVMLGTCFVDIQNYRNSAESTWGLYHSGKHFGAIGEAVRQWCANKKAEATIAV